MPDALPEGGPVLGGERVMAQATLVRSSEVSARCVSDGRVGAAGGSALPQQPRAAPTSGELVVTAHLRELCTSGSVRALSSEVVWTTHAPRGLLGSRAGGHVRVRSQLPF